MHEPSTKETAFSCPHCEAFTTQYWHELYVLQRDRDEPLPFVPDDSFVEELRNSQISNEEKEKWLEFYRKIRSKLVFTNDVCKAYNKYRLHNLFGSQCYNCRKWTIWVNENIVYPEKRFGVVPNADLPAEVLRVVEEARGILDLSPKGAAALLRLSIQMLCKHLGKPGENLNDDIASLVAVGLNPVIQKSLDVVRVIGNESVHPGSIDLNDDKEIAARLFELVNIICEQMITQPRMVDSLYEKLPDSKRTAIERRDTSAS